MWNELGMDPSDDPQAIRRAYAARLKKLDPDNDPAGFARLRQALEAALAGAGKGKSAIDPPDASSPAPNDLTGQSEISEPSPGGHILPPEEPAAAEADTITEWFDDANSGSTLLSELGSALNRHEAPTALSLYYRAAATGAIPLHAATPLLERLFAELIEAPGIGRASFRDLARVSGWDQPAVVPESTSDVRQRVLARLAAEDWYDSLTALAELRDETPRKKARLARLMLGRIGRYRMPWVDRAALKVMLEEFRTHERWLSDRIESQWARKLERRWRRREIVWTALFTIVFAVMLINWIRLFIAEVADHIGLDLGNGDLSVGMIVVTPFAVFFLLWLLKILAAGIRDAAKYPSRATPDMDHPEIHHRPPST